MSRLTSVLIAFTCFSASAHADVAVNFPLVNNSSAPELAGYVTQDIQVYTSNDWTVAGMILELTNGSIYQYTDTSFDLAPPAYLASVYPAIAFDTYVGIVDGGAGGIAGQSGDLGSPLTGWNYQLDTTGIDATWFNTYTYNYGFNTIGRISLSNDAQGTLRFALSEGHQAFVEYELDIIDGQIIPEAICDLPGDPSCGVDFIGLDQLDNVLTHWNQNVPTGDLSQGDYDHDGFVGLNDLDVILTFWNIPTYRYTTPIQIIGDHYDPFGDGFVGLDDLDLVLQHWNQSVAVSLKGVDYNGDGYVGQDDINVVLSDWNAGTPPTAVPEPASILAIMLPAPLLLRSKRTE